MDWIPADLIERLRAMATVIEELPSLCAACRELAEFVRSVLTL
jgi:hypothetical protein